MNQKDIKAIAEIIKEARLILHSFPAQDVLVIERDELVNKLADYLERECKLIYRDENSLYPEFNRKQFLTWCGV